MKQEQANLHEAPGGTSPFDSKPLLTHSAAPFWYSAEYGGDGWKSFRLMCPACGDTNCRIDPTETVIVTARNSRMTLHLGTETATKSKEAQSSVPLLRVAIFHTCGKGHGFWFSFGGFEDEGACIGVEMTDECYRELYPKTSRKWEGEVR